MCFKMFVIIFMRAKATYVKINLCKYLAKDIGDFNMK